MRKIVVGTDGSDNSIGALRWALQEARSHGASVDVVFAWEFPPVIDPLGVSMMPGVDDMNSSAEKLLGAVMKKGRRERGLGHHAGVARRTIDRAHRRRERRGLAGDRKTRPRWIPRLVARLGRPAGRAPRAVRRGGRARLNYISSA